MMNTKIIEGFTREKVLKRPDIYNKTGYLIIKIWIKLKTIIIRGEYLAAKKRRMISP